MSLIAGVWQGLLDLPDSEHDPRYPGHHSARLASCGRFCRHSRPSESAGPAAFLARLALESTARWRMGCGGGTRRKRSVRSAFDSLN